VRIRQGGKNAAELNMLPEQLEKRKESMSPKSKAVKTEKKIALRWVDARKLAVEGQGWKYTLWQYDRFPKRAKKTVPEAVWGLSHCSSGIAVRFVTTASEIHCRWKLEPGDLALNHMPATGKSGVDLYMRLPRGGWRWAGIGRPLAQKSESQIISGLQAGRREFILYFPLYNGTRSLEIGVPRNARLSAAPARPAGKKKPVVFYGTSITMGGCASRPGMAYPAIIGRWLDRPTINLGFSGSGKMETAVVDLLAELDPAAYVIDCCPNMHKEMLAERVEPLVRKLRQAHPQVPIVLVENIEHQAAALCPGIRCDVVRKNLAFRRIYRRLVASGIRRMYYVKGSDLYGRDGEATVDGVHATDLGFLRIAERIAPAVRKALTAAARA
jgi:hypothetical protein